MKEFLLDDKIFDAKLLDELNKIVRRESENKQKVGTRGPGALYRAQE